MPALSGRTLLQVVGGVAICALLILAGDTCADLVAPAQSSADSVAYASKPDTITAVVGDTLTPRFNVLVGGVKSTTARLALSANDTSVVFIASPDTNIIINGLGATWVVAKLVGANVNLNQKVPSDSVVIVAKPLRNRIQDTASTKTPTVYATSDSDSVVVVNHLNVGKTTHTFPDIGDSLPLLGVSQRIPKAGSSDSSLAAVVHWYTRKSSVVTLSQTSGQTQLITVGNGQDTVVALFGQVNSTTSAFQATDSLAIPIVVAQVLNNVKVALARDTTQTQVTLGAKGDTTSVIGIPRDSKGHALTGSAPKATITFHTNTTQNIQVNTASGVITALQQSSSSPIPDSVYAIGTAGSQTGVSANGLAVKVQQIAAKITISGDKLTPAVRVDTITAVHDSVFLTDAITDSVGATIQDSTVVLGTLLQTAWTYLNSQVASVDGHGKVKTAGIGTTKIIATAPHSPTSLPTAADTVTIVVTNPPTNVVITPDTLAIADISDTVAFTSVTARNLVGDVLANTPITWSSADTTVAKALANGSIAATGVGQTTVTANTNGVSATATITVTNSPNTVQILNDTVQITLASIGDSIVPAVNFRNGRGVVLPRSSVTWTSKAPSVATVSADGSGTIVATGVGQTFITAVSPGNSFRRDSVFVNVTNAPASVLLNVHTDTLTALGLTNTFSATAKNKRGTVITGTTNPGFAVGYASSNQAVVTVSTAGVATAQGVGTALVIATAGTQADTATMVIQNTVTSLTVTPSAATISSVGSTQQLAASATNGTGAPVPGLKFAWTTSDTTIAKVDTTGLVTAKGSGSATIKAAFGGLTGSSAVTVQNFPDTVKFTGGAVTLASLGDTITPPITLKNATGGVVAATNANWTSENTSVATVSQSGTLTAVAAGVTTVLAVSKGNTARQDSLSVTVSNAPASIVLGTHLDTLPSLGRTVQLSATVKNARAAVITGATITWAARNTAIATVASTGLVAAAGVGQTYVVGTSSPILGSSAPVSDSALIVVSNFSSSVAAAPSTVSLASVGQTQSLTTTVRNEQGNTVAGAAVTYSSANTAVATVSASATTGSGGVDTVTVTAAGVGTTTITATSNGVQTQVAVTVTNYPTTICAEQRAGCAATSKDTTLASIKDSYTPAFVITNGLGAALGNTGATWSTSDQTVATVSSAGLATAVGAGSAYIKATSPGNSTVADSIKVTVSNAPATLTVVPSGTTTLTAFGATQNFLATVRNARGDSIASPSPAATWSSNSAVVTIGASTGVATAVSTGTATITATAGSATNTATVTVAQSASTAKSTISTSASSITADGSSTATITVQLKDSLGSNLSASGGTVTLASSGTGTLSAVTNNNNGTYTATLTAPTTVGSMTISGSIGSNAITSGNKTVSYVAGAGTKYLVTPSSLTPAAGSAVSVTAQLTDVNGNAVATSGKTVTWTHTGNGHFSAATSSTNSSGVATITYTADSTASATQFVTATDNNSLTGTSVSITSLGVIAGAATAIASTSFTANWSSAAGATSYQLDVSTDSTFAGSFVAGFNNQNVGNVTSESVTGLSSGVTYYYRVRAVGSSGTSVSSTVISAITLSSAPTANAATSVTVSGFTANWTAATGATSYQMDVATANDFSVYVAGYQNLNVGSGTSQAIPGLSSGTTYYYRVRSVGSSGTSGNSSTITVLTVSAAPVAAVATAITAGGFTANWSTAVGASSYQLDVSTDPAFGSFVAGYNALAVSGGSSTSQAVTGLSGATTYYYRVRAVNGSGTSASSSSISALTLLGAPTASAASAITVSGFTANWSAATGATGYQLDVSTVNTFASFVAGYQSLSVSGTSQPVTGLSAGTTYYYQVRAVNGSGTSANSSGITVLTVPAAPVASAGTSVSSVGFTANWATVTGAANYQLDVATDIGFTSLVSGYSSLAVSGGSTTSQAVTGLSAGTTYYFRVRAVNATPSSGASSSTISVVTLAAPTATAATTLTASGFTATWTAYSGATDYRIDVSTDNFTTFVSHDADAGIGTSFAVGSLSAGTTYQYQIRAVVAGPTTTANSNTVTALTIPGAPTVAAATALTATSFTANWSSPGGTVASYALDVSTDNTFGSFLSGYQNLSVTGTSQVITGLSSGTTYYYRVRAVNASGTGANSGNGSALTVAPAPSASAATSVTAAGFTANWAVATGAASYQLDVSTDPAFGSFVSGYNSLAVAGGSTASQAVTSLSGGTTYYYRVRAVNASGTSASSSTISLTTALAAPTTTAATSVTASSFTANWNAASGATSYQLDVSTVNTFASFVSGYQSLGVSGTSQPVTGLSAGTTYYYQVRAVNAGGTSASSSAASALTLPAAPVASAGTSVSSIGFTANWATVTGAANYQLDVATDIGFTSLVSGYSSLAVSGGSTTSQVVTGLAAGTTYYVRVRAVNATPSAGASSNTISVATLAAPTATTATGVTAAGFMATWAAYSGATDYRIDVSTDNFTTFVSQNADAGSGTSFAVGSLSAGTTYQYLIRAVVAGPLTTANSNTITALTLPGAPTVGTATALTATSFTANWSSPGGTAASYALDVSTDNNFGSFLSGYQNLGVTGTSQVVTGLSSGTIYYYRVRAVNASGTGTNSGNGSALTVAPAPSAAAATSITAAGFTANWTVASGAASYQLDVSTDPAFGSFVAGYGPLAVAGASTTSQAVTGLAGGTTYYYRVRAVNASGTSASSSTISLTTLLGPPTTTAATSVTASSFTANWNAATGATSYQLDVATVSDFSVFVPGYQNLSVSGTAQTVTGLSAGTTYYYQVRAVNAGGTSTSSTPAIITLTLPAAPVASAGTGVSSIGFTANWASVTSATSYNIDVSTDNFTTFVEQNVSAGSGTSTAVSGLMAGTTYQYRLRASNGTGAGANSNRITVTTLAAPTATAATSPTASGFTATWSAYSGATDYRIDVSTNNFTTFVSQDADAGSGTSFAVGSLSAGTTYQYRIRAVVAGLITTANSNVISLTTLLGAPTTTAATSVTASSFTANWNAASGATSYQLDVSTDNTFLIAGDFAPGYQNLSVSGTAQAVTGLGAGTTYYYQVRAVNAGGASASSTPAITAITLPSAPVASAASSVTTTGFTANWATVTGAASYQLDVSTDPAFGSFVSGYGPLAVSGGSTTSQAVTLLSSGVTYYYRVLAVNATPASGVNSSSISVTTIGSTPVATAGTSIGTIGFTANWNSVSGATGYQIDVATDAGFTSYVSGYQSLAVGNATSQSVTGLSASTTYYYRIRAVTSGGTTSNSNTITLTTLGTPVATAATSVAVTGFTANWNTFVDATSYRLDVATTVGFTSFVSGDSDKAETTTSDAITGLTGGTTYYYRVRAVVAGVATSSSTTITATTFSIDGSGTGNIAPVSISQGTDPDTTLTMTYTAATGGIEAGAQVTMLVPALWSAPQTSSTATAGYVTVNGTTTGVMISGSGPWTITYTTPSSVSGGSTITFVYGDTTAGPNRAAAAVVPHPASYVFQVQESEPGGTLTDVLGTQTVVVGTELLDEPNVRGPSTPISTLGACLNAYCVALLTPSYLSSRLVTPSKYLADGQLPAFKQ